jgi:glycosyltransferase involved in cell wall biosynthesis
MDRPIVWTLHDMWPFTGGCHYDDECGKYAEDCGRCPVLQSDKEDDLSRSVLRRKRAAWAGKSITVVATSKWLRDCAASSSLFKECRIELLPNCVDTQKYQPLEKAPVRRLFGLDVNAKTILFSGANAHKDPRKGLNHLFDALQILEQGGFAKNEVQVVLLGIPQEATLPPCPFRVMRIPHLYDDVSQVALYNAADVVAAPSLQENLSNVVVEAVCCGTPVVAFDIGGMPDIVTPGETGYLAQPFSAQSLAEGMRTLLRIDPGRATELSRRCRQLAQSRYAEEVVAKRYIDLYAEVMRTFAMSNARARS